MRKKMFSLEIEFDNFGKEKFMEGLCAENLYHEYSKTILITGLHPHNMDMIIMYKLRPVKIPFPSTKADGRRDVRFL